MPEDDLEKLSRLISEAKRLAMSDQWEAVAFLLGLAEIEAAKIEYVPAATKSAPKRPKSSSRRRQR